jgi:hypothetical protein
METYGRSENEGGISALNCNGGNNLILKEKSTEQ